MDDSKGTHSSQEQPARQHFPEVKGKTVDIVELVAESDYYGISIRFQDQTALTLAFEPCIFTFPVYEDWTQGEAKTIKEYEPVQSAVLRR